MNRFLFHLAIGIGLCVLPVPGTGAAGPDFHPVFRILDGASGLPDQHVEAVVQDTHGFVWIGTRGGLLRHEGRDISLLPRDPADPAALPDNNIMSLHAHSDGMVWAGVSGAGVVEIGPDLIPRRHLAPVTTGGVLPHAQVWSMTEDCDGHLWMAFMRGGLARLDPHSETLLEVDQSETYGLTPEGFQIQLAVDTECRIWLAQSHRLSVMSSDAETPHFVRVMDGGPDFQNFFFAILEHQELGVLTGRGNDLFRMVESDTAPAEFEGRLLASVPGLIVGLGELPDGRLLISTTEGLTLLDPATLTQAHITARRDLVDGLPGERMAGSVLVDREGGAWLPVVQSGLVYLPPEHGVFGRLQDGLAQPNGELFDRIQVVRPGLESDVVWVAAMGGIRRIDLVSGAIEYGRDLLPGHPQGVTRREYRGLNERADGLLVLDDGTLMWLAYAPDQSEVLIDRSDIDNASFRFMVPDGADALWLGTTTAGLVRYELGSRRLTRYGPDQPPPRALPESMPRLIRQTPEGGFVAAGDTTLYHYRSHGGFVPIAEIERGRISDLAFAGPDVFWLATDAGLSEWRWGAGQVEPIRNYDISRLVERTSLRQVFPLAADELWLVMSSGVAHLNSQTGESRLFTRADGLPAAEFSTDAGIQLADGRLLLGGSLGLVMVNPGQLLAEPVKPPVYLRRVVAADLDQMLTPGARTPLALDWRQNTVRFEFSALSFVAPERLRYRVRLHGWDEDWIELRASGQMNYSNLRPGRYVFEVQAATHTGGWNEDGDRLILEVAPPPWATTGAYAAYLGLLLLVIAAILIGLQQTRRRRRQVREIQQKRALAEQQRKLLERLNADLEPLPLARTIAAEIQSISAARQVIFGYVHEQMPLELITLGEDDAPSREAWLAGLAVADGHQARSVALSAERQSVARVLLRAPAGGFLPDHEQRLALLVGLAGQALHNSLLLQQVKQLAERAEAANRAKSEFLATMSHEIRTPLHGVLGMADLIHETEQDPDKIDLIETLRNSGRQLQRIIDDVLDVSRIEAGRLSVRHEPFELASLLEQVLDLHAPNAARKQIDLRLQIHSDLPMLAWGDSDRLAQVLGNLVSNAVKFSERGAVELAALVNGDDQLVFAVRDSGPGIAETQRSQLFQPFSQLDSSISRKHPGSGLGLAISRRLAEAMGGSLELGVRRWPGSTFILRLPNSAARLSRPPSELLRPLTVAALLDAPSYRVVHRLARRWGFALHNGWRSRPQPGAVLLLDARKLPAGPQVEAWLASCPGGLCLQSPYLQNAASIQPLPPGFRFLRWPLHEGRLIAALLDCLLQPSQ